MIKSSMSLELFRQKWGCTSLNSAQPSFYVIARKTSIRCVSFSSWRELLNWSANIDWQIIALYLTVRQQEYIF